ncbi:hypothetical protein CUC08_Gglean002012 [Alternaria sp. MG1]|uniref:LITAF domain-containing protein n=2 Tax=Alternaria alternata complex TaxID=187734 RepID=A0A4Q4NIT7_ALTAL|nr:hypothetical protein CUC08_Gglean002012 [Alternaria sp. MG1]RYN37547.1 hypothetical protein AA0115_g999 [Alternaria tenuissima]RYN77572.1 hypothetical protein AA0117_g4900 [Alternaria alternata]RYO09499.1 hypothetical protein AA0119_g788 [Alternaria tenuissima]RYO21340.1 hypothetical protein AA0121_g2965 [Alternaria tenuissima]
MGIPTTPQEAAPAYEEVFNDHPVNRCAPSGSASAYATLPQTDDHDIELHAQSHNHTSSSIAAPAISSSPETLAQTITNFLRPNPEPHTHCEVCDNQVQIEARRRREGEKYCCTMVAATFMTLFVCGMLLGVSIVAMAAKRKMSED